LVVFFSFVLFFAMIISDAGYAVVMFGLLGLYWGKLGGSESGRRLRSLCVALFGAAFVWGVLAGGYFGVSPPEGSVLGWLHVIDLNDFDFMMKLSIVIGVLHIMLANGIVAYLNWRHRTVAYPKLGWNCVALGGLALWLSGDAGAFAWLGWALLAVGVAAIFWFSSERSFGNAKDAALRVLEGLKALAGLSGLFGDVLSYMRLFALGLASASLALTFNQLAGQVEQAVPGLGMLLAILILLIGHVMNLGLAVMSGVVHGLRLNYIEFYKWGLSEEGYPFKAFARKEVQP
jgi:V/A-type H+-transporting ATPase subunit I